MATSTAVKARYNKKHYKEWRAIIKVAEFEKVDEIRKKEDLSRSEFLKMLVKSKYGINFDED